LRHHQLGLSSLVITAVILAGGLGTRLRSVVPDLPKPMAPVNGRPFLAYQMDYWLQQGIQHFVLSVGYRHQSIMDYFGSNYCGSPVEYVVEDTPLGTGGGLLLAVEKLSPNDPFLLLNGDTYFAVDLARLDAFAREMQADWCFSLFRTDEAGRYMGMDVAANGQIIRLKSESVGGGGLANGGVYWVHPRALRDGAFAVGSSISLENDLFPASVAAGQKLMGLEFCGTFIDIGVPADYQRAPVLLAA
jgi:D-glycero-alpha-D-manno-heptose 1-phosphate guanylyltransferase